MIASYIVILGLWILVFLNWKLFHDPIYPGLLQSALWAVCVTALVILSSDFDTMHAETWMLILVGVLCFSVSSFLATFGHRPCRYFNSPRSIPQKLVIKILLIVLIACLPLIVLEAYRFMYRGPTENTFVNLRYAISIDNQRYGYGIKAYLITLSFFLADIQLIRYLALKKRQELFITILCIIVAIIYALLSTGRGTIFSFLLTQVIIIIVLRRASALKMWLFVFITGMALFVCLGILMNKFGTLAGGVNSVTLGDVYKSYFLSSIPAFDQLVVKGSPYNGGIHTFRSILAILKPLDGNIKVPSLVAKFTAVPYETNLYTVYSPYYEDYGFMAIPLFQILFGFMHGFLYKRATKRDPKPIYLLMFSVLLFALITQPSLDSYFSLLSTWVQYLAYSSIFLVILTVKMKRNVSIHA